MKCIGSWNCREADYWALKTILAQDTAMQVYTLLKKFLITPPPSPEKKKMHAMRPIFTVTATVSCWLENHPHIKLADNNQKSCILALYWTNSKHAEIVQASMLFIQDKKLMGSFFTQVYLINLMGLNFKFGEATEFNDALPPVQNHHHPPLCLASCEGAVEMSALDLGHLPLASPSTPSPVQLYANHDQHPLSNDHLPYPS